jgi:N-formylglutamate deformylase
MFKRGGPNVYTLAAPQQESIPIIADSPHSGWIFPRGLFTKAHQRLLRRWQDRFIHQLYDFLPDLGAPLLAARFHRGFIDLNRDMLDISPAILTDGATAILQPSAKTMSGGNGLFKMNGPEGAAFYPVGLTPTQIADFVDDYYTPYYTKLGQLIQQQRHAHGGVLHLNLHAMFSEVDGEQRPDVVISNNRHRTSSRMVALAVADCFRQQGFSVQLNKPFLGGQLVRHFGNPKAGVHSVQIELKKALYMSEQTYEKHQSYPTTKQRLQQVMHNVAAWTRQHFG